MRFLGAQKLIKIALLLCFSLSAMSQSSSQNNEPDPDKQLEVTEALFKCLTEMTRSSTGAFFVDNMLGDIDATVAVANSETGGEYPVGSLVSLIPTEVMIKHREGWNETTNDWEFFELTVSEEGSEIAVRGTTEVVNRFGGNCFGCHMLARSEWDLICGTGHGCAPLPIDRETIANMQNGNPRCIKQD